MAYTPTIGIEVHAELKTATKMFCNSKNDPNESRPNINICPICLAHPGTLPTINKEAVRHVLRVGVAMGGKLADHTEFDRKNYFYPDLPKGYQISQYRHPLVLGGELAGILLTRIHLEEDTARSSHADKGSSLVDFNRAGIPLMELVTEPVIKSAKEAGMFARELQLLLRTLGVSNANMEKGEMRVEANISISEKDTLGTKVEVKNLNSFRIVERAILYEIARQEEVLSKGDKVLQETRGWDESRGQTFSQRIKEDSHDYRYFPDPDLPSLRLSEIKDFSEDTLRADMEELPWEKRNRYTDSFGIKLEDANIFLQNRRLDELFEYMTDRKDININTLQIIANYLTSDVLGLIQKNEKSQYPSKSQFVDIMELVLSGKISSRGAKNILEEIIINLSQKKAGNVADDLGIMQQSDTAVLQKVVDEVLKENPDIIVQYKNGKINVLQFLVGQAMKKTKGSANPKVLQELFTTSIL